MLASLFFVSGPVGPWLHSRCTGHLSGCPFRRGETSARLLAEAAPSVPGQAAGVLPDHLLPQALIGSPCSFRHVHALHVHEPPRMMEGLVSVRLVGWRRARGFPCRNQRVFRRRRIMWLSARW